MSAIISPCGQYRYQLSREPHDLYTTCGPALFIMLNPSTADAALDVVVGHKVITRLEGFGDDPTVQSTLRYLAQGIAYFCHGGAAPVVIFFFTSGYIITHVLRSETPGEFAIKRAFRIYPLFMFAVLAEIILGAVVNGTPVPSPSILIPRLLLIGDFFNTPYALGNVEWSLRIELMFYIFMAISKRAGLMSSPNLLVGTFTLATVILAIAPPFPHFAGWTDGYLSFMGPMLFIGSIIYLYERKLATGKTCLLAVGIILFTILCSMANLQGGLRNNNFVAVSLGVFGAAWLFRARLEGGYIVRLLSDLTYAVYLIHNWLWNYIDQLMRTLAFPPDHRNTQIMAVIFVVSYLLHVTVEKYGIRAGRIIIGMMRAKKPVRQMATVA
jgi:peptidoglycan/LPS O-acetylase OafA/YrhL